MQILRESQSESKICLSYLGSFNDEITDKLTGISEYFLENSAVLSKLKNKVSFLIAECFQNIVRHKEPNAETTNIPANHLDFFQLNVLEDRTVLSSCNLVIESDIDELEKKLIRVNSLGPDELKKLYNEVISNASFSQKGGAGLGLIEMARKSGLPLKYFFQNAGDGFFRFFLSLEVIYKKDNPIQKVKMEDIENTYNTLAKENVMLSYKGDLSKDIIIPLVEMVQNNFADAQNSSGNEKRSIVTLIEALQNISKHGKSVNGVKEGVFTLIKAENAYVMNVGNTIDKESAVAFENSLNEIKQMSSDKVKNLYKKKLFNSEINEEGNAGLGLLEIAKNSSGNFDYNFSPTMDGDVFFTITITV